MRRSIQGFQTSLGFLVGSTGYAALVLWVATDTTRVAFSISEFWGNVSWHSPRVTSTFYAPLGDNEHRTASRRQSVGKVPPELRSVVSMGDSPQGYTMLPSDYPSGNKVCTQTSILTRELSGPHPLCRVMEIVSEPRIWNCVDATTSLEAQSIPQITRQEGL